jgi:prepilin peptidase CpaA
MIKDLLLLTIFPGAMALAAATDLFTMTVPNRIALVLVAGFLIAAPLVGLGWPEIGLHFGLAVAALVVTFTLFSFGWIGGGTPSCSPPPASGSARRRSSAIVCSPP